jgi:hypothetical protein
VLEDVTEFEHMHINLEITIKDTINDQPYFTSTNPDFSI